MAAIITCSDLGALINKVCHRFQCFPLYLPWSNGTRCWSWFSEYWVLIQYFHSPPSLSSRGSLALFHFLPYGWCYLHIWGYCYFSWQSGFQLVLLPAQLFLMMYSAYKLSKQSDNIQPWHTPFPIWNQSVVPCPVLTVASWPAYRFLKRQVRWSGIPISWRISHSLLGPHSQRLWHRQ